MTHTQVGAAPTVHNHLEADITDLDKYSQSEVDGLLAGKEDHLGNPSVDDYLLSSSAAGVRTWVPPGSLGIPDFLILTSLHTAAKHEYLFADTSGGPFQINMPPTPDPGDWVWIKSANDAATIPVMVNGNGNNIMGLPETMDLDVRNWDVILTFKDATTGWAL